MATSRKPKDYEHIEREYNSLLERDADLVYTLGSVNQEDTGASFGTSSQGNDITEIEDVTVNGTLVSQLWQPKSAGFSLDARTGYAELNNAYIQGEVVGYVKQTAGSFGGDGSDGALEKDTGTETINALNARVVVKNYTNITLSGTASLTISNPNDNGTILILRSQGDVKITSTADPVINMKGMGALGGTGGALNSDGNVGSAGFSLPYTAAESPAGAAGTSGSNGAGGTAAYPTFNSDDAFYSKTLMVACGAGGGGGKGGSTGLGGDGGRGGGVIVIECAGSLTYTSSKGMSVGGNNGNNGNSNGGGGGGGGAGMGLIFYNSVTALTGGYTTTGGTGGSTGGANSGGGGASVYDNGDAGSAGGGAGGGGLAAVNYNEYFA